MAVSDTDSAVTRVALMGRVEDMIITRRDPREVIALLHHARQLLDRAEAAVGGPRTPEHSGFSDAVPHLHWKLVQLEQVAKLVE